MMQDTDIPWEIAPLLLAVGLALSMRPWRLLRQQELWTPLLATLTIAPWLWALPMLHAMPLPARLTGSCLALLMLGWPLAVPVLCGVAVLAGLLGGASVSWMVTGAFWLGVLPATLALGLGALLRRLFGARIFIYILGRGFLGTVACTFAASMMAAWFAPDSLSIDSQLGTVARWLLAWGDGFATGMLVAVFVAFRPQWLATWSDQLYLPAPQR